MFTVSLSYESILFSLIGLVAVLVVVVAVALWNDYRAGVFVEVHICEGCGYEASSVDSIFCADCDHAQTCTGEVIIGFACARCY
jgi:hypothetical protein